MNATLQDTVDTSSETLSTILGTWIEENYTEISLGAEKGSKENETLMLLRKTNM